MSPVPPDAFGIERDLTSWRILEAINKAMDATLHMCIAEIEADMVVVTIEAIEVQHSTARLQARKVPSKLGVTPIPCANCSRELWPKTRPHAAGDTSSFNRD